MTTRPADRKPGGLASQEEKKTMPQIDIEILTPFAAKFLEGTTLTPAERAEVLRIAQGFACKDSARSAGVRVVPSRNLAANGVRISISI